MSDILYDKIPGPEGTIRTETEKLTDQVEIEYEVTVRNGVEQSVVKKITVTARGVVKVVVDDKIIIDPSPPCVDEDCYY